MRAFKCCTASGFYIIAHACSIQMSLSLGLPIDASNSEVTAFQKLHSVLCCIVLGFCQFTCHIHNDAFS